MLCAVVLVGCGDMPKPFRHDQAGQPLTRLETAGRVSVVAPDQPALAESVIHSLQTEGVPARIGRPEDLAAEGGYLAQATTEPDRTRWQLFNPEGTVILTRSLSPEATPSHYRELARTIHEAVGKDMEAPLIARMAAPAPDPIPGLRAVPEASPVGDASIPAPLETLPALALGTIGGFGAGRDDVLRGALETSLTRVGLKVAADGPFVIDGDATQEVIAGVTRLRVVWTVRGPDGEDVGTISQENPVEEDFLTGQFPALAVAIADGGTEGIYAMISRLRVDPALLQAHQKEKASASGSK